MDPALLGSFGAWKPGGHFPGAGVETTSWDLGFLLRSTLDGSNSRAIAGCWRDGVRHCRRSDEVSARREGRPFKIASNQHFEKQRFGAERYLGHASLASHASHASSLQSRPRPGAVIQAAQARNSYCSRCFCLSGCAELVTLRYVHSRNTSTSTSPSARGGDASLGVGALSGSKRPSR
jgi:hypothetical protein